MRKLYSVLLFVTVAITAAVCHRPPWYRPCWAFLCGYDAINPVCSWDPERGSRLFKNECGMKRHNYCYDRNYAIVNKNMGFYESLSLCSTLKNLTKPNYKKMQKFHRLPTRY